MSTDRPSGPIDRPYERQELWTERHRDYTRDPMTADELTGTGR